MCIRDRRLPVPAGGVGQQNHADRPPRVHGRRRRLPAAHSPLLPRREDGCFGERRSIFAFDWAVWSQHQKPGFPETGYGGNAEAGWLYWSDPGNGGSKMQVTELALPGVKLIIPTYFDDNRGYSTEAYNDRTLREYGITTQFVVDYECCNLKSGTIRGIHFQNNPHPVSYTHLFPHIQNLME